MKRNKVVKWHTICCLMAFVTFWQTFAHAQVVNFGVDMTFLGDVEVHIHETYTDSLGGEISNDGQLYFYHSIFNQTENPAINPAGAGRILFNGDGDQYITGKEFTFGNLEIDKPIGDLVLNDSISVSGQVIFTTGRLLLNGKDLLLRSTGSLVNEGEGSHAFGSEGAIRATDRFINHPDISENLAGLGIFFGTSGDFGRSIITRHNKVIPGVSGGSIQRQYEFTPESSNPVFPTLVKINYLPHELEGVEESSLAVWRDADKNGNWALENSVTDDESNQVTAGFVKNLGSAIITLASRDCPDTPIIQLGEDEQIVCAGSSLLLNTQLDDPKYSYMWYQDDVIVEENTASISVTDPGVYRVEVTQANGCNASAEVVVIQKGLPVVSFESNEACFGSTTEFTNLSSIDEGSLTYHWDFGNEESNADTAVIANPEYTYPAQGSFQVTLIAKSEAGCADTLHQDVPVLAPPIVDFTVAGFCQEAEMTFTSKVLVPEGQQATEYAWDFDGVSSANGEEVSHTFEMSGYYDITLTVSTDKNCSASSTQNITINQMPDPTFTAIPQCKANDILITNTTPALDEIESQIFYFHDGSTSSSGIFSKTYESVGEFEITLEVTMNNGCKKSISQSVAVELREPQIAPEVITCGDSFTFSVDPATLPEGSSWIWNDGTSETTYIAAQSGIHWVEITEPGACVHRDSVNLVLKSELVLSLEEELTSCGPTTLETGEFPYVSYLWSDGSTNPSLTVTETGTYTVHITDQNNCVSEATSEVAILPVPEFNLGEDTTLCDGGEMVLLPGVENMTYQWSDGSTREFITVTSEGTYGLTLTNNEQCSSYDEISVSYHEPYQVSLGDDNVICEGSSLVLTTEIPADKYQWRQDEEVISTDRSLEVTEEGEYWVIAEDEFGCTGADTIYVTRKEKPTARFLASSEIEIGDTLQFIQLSYPDPLNFAWEFGDGNSSPNEDPVHIYFEEGEYDVKLKVDNGACVDEITKMVKVVPVGESSFGFEGFPDPLISEINVYPNPFETMVTLEIKLNRESEAYVRITNISGMVKKEISFTALEWSGTIDLSGEQNGVYLLSVYVGDESRVFRLVKQ